MPAPTVSFQDRPGRALRLIMAMIGISSLSVAANAAVFSTDQRHLLRHTPAQRPPEDARKNAPPPPADLSVDLHDSIGTLYAADTGTFCTAFCVAPDKIATASHCVYGAPGSQRPSLHNLRFKLGGGALEKDGGVPLAGHAIANEAQHVIAGTRSLDLSPPIGAAQDWAVARLDAPACARPLPISKLTRAEIDRRARRDAIYQVAVHTDSGQKQLMRAGPCRERLADPHLDRRDIARDFKAPENIIFHDCATGGGSSGSPMLIDTAGGPEVVAINVGTYVLRQPTLTAAASNTTKRNEPIANTAIEIVALPDAITRLDRDRAISTVDELVAMQKLFKANHLIDGRQPAWVTMKLLDAAAELTGWKGRGRDTQLRRALIAEPTANGGIATGSLQEPNQDVERR